MPTNWSQKPQFKSILRKLVVTDELGFQRAVLPLLQLINPELVEAPARRSADRCGIDHLVWEHNGGFPLVIQTKGFTVDAAELGNSQIRQCRDSIEKFRSSGLKATKYILIHNRDGRSENFRKSVLAHLEELEAANVAERAELWDPNNLIDRAFDAMEAHVQQSCRIRHFSFYDPSLQDESGTGVLADNLPYEVEVLKINQWGEPQTQSSGSHWGDPWSIMDLSRPAARVLVLGEFGMGKTTLALRGLNCLPANFHPLFIPASQIIPGTGGARHFISQCINIEDLLAGLQDNHLDLLKDLVVPVVERMFFHQESGIVLLIDGLDESSIIYKPEGMQRFFNYLQDAEVPVVITMRTELWHQRLGDFSSYSGARSAKRPKRKVQKLTKIELLPWSQSHIADLTNRRIAAEEDPTAKERLLEFGALVADNRYNDTFGDIPRRPLYLHMLLDVIADEGVHKLRKAELVRSFVCRKIQRDRDSQERTSIAGDARSRDETLRIAWSAMLIAAALMTRTHEKTVELLPTCSAEEVMRRDRRLQGETSSLGLVLNSVLVPVKRPTSQQGEIQVRFAHRMFQEYFLAEYVCSHPEEFKFVTIPKDVSDWVNELHLD